MTLSECSRLGGKLLRRTLLTLVITRELIVNREVISSRVSIASRLQGLGWCRTIGIEIAADSNQEQDHHSHTTQHDPTSSPALWTDRWSLNKRLLLIRI